MWWTIIDYKPSTNAEQTCFQKILDLQQTLTDARRYRLQVSKVGMPAVLWIVLVAGGVLTILFTYLFEVEEQKSHIVMTSLVVLALSLNFLLVALFSNPYKGHMRIAATPFLYDQKVMVELLRERPDVAAKQ
jgi:cytochrome c biogenesis protein CcdA